MRIVVLDGYALNPGDLSWDSMQALGSSFVQYARTGASQIVERAKEAEIVIVNKTPLTKETLDQLPHCKYIGLLATGYDNVDTAYAKKKGIPVANIPAYSSAAVAQFVFALLLELCSHVQRHSDSARAGKWQTGADFSYRETPLIELQGKTLGLVGLGGIGRQTALIARAFGMRVVAANRSNRLPEGLDFVRLASIEEVFSEADALSLHCPLLPETLGLVNKERLVLMKKSAFFINTARGKLVIEQDLADALNSGAIAGAGLDVLWDEPPRDGSPLLSAKNCLITPHIAWAAQEARARLMKIAVANIQAFINGAPQNIVNL